MNREFVEYLSQRTDETLAVATILHTAGSTPRKAGTSMVVFPDGSIFGLLAVAAQKMKYASVLLIP